MAGRRAWKSSSARSAIKAVYVRGGWLTFVLGTIDALEDARRAELAVALQAQVASELRAMGCSRKFASEVRVALSCWDRIIKQGGPWNAPDLGTPA
jgi:hypothetical protein